MPSNDSSSVLSYQELPAIIQCGEAKTRGRKEDRRVSLGNPVGQPWTLIVTLPHVRDGLRVLLMAVLRTVPQALHLAQYVFQGAT